MRPFFFFFSPLERVPFHFFFSSLFLSSIQPRSGSSKFGCRRIERRQIRFGFEGKKESRGEKGPAINARGSGVCNGPVKASALIMKSFLILSTKESCISVS